MGCCPILSEHLSLRRGETTGHLPSEMYILEYDEHGTGEESGRLG